MRRGEGGVADRERGRKEGGVPSSASEGGSKEFSSRRDFRGKGKATTACWRGGESDLSADSRRAKSACQRA